MEPELALVIGVSVLVIIGIILYLFRGDPVPDTSNIGASTYSISGFTTDAR
jgi:hypothetical protein